MSYLKYGNVCFILNFVLSCRSIFGATTRVKSELHQELLIQATHIAENPIFQSRWRYDNNDRNTSAAYDLWDRAGYHLFEWPGNITQMDYDYPLLRWGKARSKFIQSPCEAERGMELATYAHKYLHLTWGANRLTSSYCNPLRVRRKDLPEEERWRKEYEIVAVDFDFVFDALLVVTDQGYIIRVGGIEIAYRRAQKIRANEFHGNLTTVIAKGITSSVNKIITQKCCTKSTDYCSHGETVLAYRESSYMPLIFISYDGGKSFKEVELKLPASANFLHTLLFYPTWKRVIALHGNPSYGYFNEFSTQSGLPKKFKNDDKLNVTIQGFVQSSRVINEMSFLLWDECHVWYGYPAKGELQLKKAVLYIHNSIRMDIKEANAGENTVPHVIRHSHCHFGKESMLTFGDEGKVGLLDKNNVFFYGVDLKSVDFPLVGLATDMTLLLPEKRYTVCPCYDRNNRPKLLYPPRYLRIPDPNMMDKNYSKRLAMRIVKKTLFPSDFMAPFYEENLKNLPSHYKYLEIAKCKTSSLSIDGSLTQKAKTYKLNLKEPIYITITFISTSDASRQLQYEPQDLSVIFDVKVVLHSFSATSGNRFWFKYAVNITLKRDYDELFSDQEMFLMNFFTFKTLRCAHQPQYPIWIKVDHSFRTATPPKLSKAKKEESFPPTRNIGSDSSEILRIHHCPHHREMDSKATGVCSGSTLSSQISQ